MRITDMKKNVGSIDRIIRFVIAAAIALLYFTGVISSTVAIVLGILAVVLALTGLLSVCPLYMLFNFSTRNKQTPAHSA